MIWIAQLGNVLDSCFILINNSSPKLLWLVPLCHTISILGYTECVALPQSVSAGSRKWDDKTVNLCNKTYTGNPFTFWSNLMLSTYTHSFYRKPKLLLKPETFFKKSSDWSPKTCLLCICLVASSLFFIFFKIGMTAESQKHG